MVINATASKLGRSFRWAAPKVPSVSPLALSPRLVQVDAGSSQSCLCHSPSGWRLFNPMLSQSQCSLEFARLYFCWRHRGKGTRARPTWTLPQSRALPDPPARCSVKQSPAGRGKTTIVILPVPASPDGLSRVAQAPRSAGAHRRRNPCFVRSRGVTCTPEVRGTCAQQERGLAPTS